MEKEQEKALKAREAALKGALMQIDKQFGAGSIMKMGDDSMQVQVAAIPTGALSLDIALGVGGVPRGRIVEVFGPESSGKTTLVYHVLANAQKPAGSARSSTRSTPWTRRTRSGSAWTSTSCWSRSPTTASRRSRSPTC